MLILMSAPRVLTQDFFIAPKSLHYLMYGESYQTFYNCHLILLGFYLIL